MPRNSAHTAELQKQRQKLKEKAHKYVPGTVSLQVLGSGAKGAPRSLYVFTDQFRYLFNCGEGTQRLAHEHKMKLSKLEHIFITNPTWENIGGLPGVALTIQDVGVPEITLHGPVGTDEIFTATQRFVILKDLQINMASCSADDSFEDSVMTVNYVPIVGASENKNGESVCSSSGNVASPERTSTSSPHESDDDVDYYAHERKRKKRRSSRERSLAGKRRRTNDLAPRDPVALNYICRLKARPGALCLDRCVELGVPAGPLLGRLKAGIDVTLPNGNVVKSVDVTEPDDPGPIFIVVDCPTPSHLDSLAKNPAFACHQSSASSELDVAFLVVHFTPQHVMQDPRYQKWMNDFYPSTIHLVINESNDCMGSVAVHRIQHKLHLLHPDIFPLLQDKGIPLGQLKKLVNEDTLRIKYEKVESENVDEKASNKENNGSTSDEVFSVIQARTFSTVHLRPQRRVDRKAKLILDPESFVAEVHDAEGVSESLATLQTKLLETKVDKERKFPQVLFLGTGSCIPNKTRNTSGILVHTSENDSLLLDCGEGTYGQLVRFFGPEKVDEIVRRIRAVFVSHLHADHHIGLVGVLKARREALCGVQSPLYLIAPKQIMSWLKLYHRCFEPVLQEFVLVSNGNLNYEARKDEKMLSQVQSELHMTNISTCAVQHCPNAFGIALTHQDGWKLTYSGDTMPCDRLVDIGAGSDLLIHEATMEDDLVGEARSKLHSTTSQAISVGNLMDAKFTLLTHFSQRYAKIPRLNKNFTQNVGIAFDNMQVSLGQLPLLPLMYKPLRLMFAEHYEEMEQKTARRLLKKERELQAVKT